VQIIDPREIDVVVNTGDDVVVGEAYVSPDVDAVLYTLAGIIDEEKWYGIEGDSYKKYESRRKRGIDDLLRLGDRDREYCEERGRMIWEGGKTLSDAISLQRERMGVVPRVFPMSDSRVTTLVKTPAGLKEFQEYWVRGSGKEEFLGVEFRGISVARMSPGFMESLDLARAVIVGPSNPITSIGPIVNIDGVQEALADRFVVAISPIRGGSPFSGPVGSMLKGLGYEISPVSIASLYSGFLDYLIIDRDDSSLREEIEGEYGIRVGLGEIYMKSPEDKFKLAQTALAACREGEKYGR